MLALAPFFRCLFCVFPRAQLRSYLTSVPAQGQKPRARSASPRLSSITNVFEPKKDIKKTSEEGAWRTPKPPAESKRAGQTAPPSASRLATRHPEQPGPPLDSLANRSQFSSHETSKRIPNRCSGNSLNPHPRLLTPDRMQPRRNRKSGGSSIRGPFPAEVQKQQSISAI